MREQEYLKVHTTHPSGGGLILTPLALVQQARHWLLVSRFYQVLERDILWWGAALCSSGGAAHPSHLITGNTNELSSSPPPPPPAASNLSFKRGFANISQTRRRPSQRTSLGALIKKTLRQTGVTHGKQT